MAETRAVFSPCIVNNKEFDSVIGWDSTLQQQISYMAGDNITIDSATGKISASGGGGTPGGSTTEVQYNNAGVFGGITGATTNGTVMTLTSPILITPNIGVATATKINGLTITNSTGTLTIVDGKTATISNTLTFSGTDGKSVAFGNGGTVTYTSNNLSVFAATTSSQLAGVISDETGSGALVFATSPTLSNPVVGTQAQGDNSTKAASTAFVNQSAASVLFMYQNFN